jgi:hypothetical protein
MRVKKLNKMKVLCLAIFYASLGASFSAIGAELSVGDVGAASYYPGYSPSTYYYDTYAYYNYNPYISCSFPLPYYYDDCYYWGGYYPYYPYYYYYPWFIPINYSIYHHHPMDMDDYYSYPYYTNPFYSYRHPYPMHSLYPYAPLGVHPNRVYPTPVVQSHPNALHSNAGQALPKAHEMQTAPLGAAHHLVQPSPVHLHGAAPIMPHHHYAPPGSMTVMPYHQRANFGAAPHAFPHVYMRAPRGPFFQMFVPQNNMGRPAPIFFGAPRGGIQEAAPIMIHGGGDGADFGGFHGGGGGDGFHIEGGGFGGGFHGGRR